jgi:hypothetical protein
MPKGAQRFGFEDSRRLYYSAILTFLKIDGIIGTEEFERCVDSIACDTIPLHGVTFIE